MDQSLSQVFPLRNGRVHEVFGAGALGFALATAAQQSEMILWIKERWQTESLNPVGIGPYINPSQILMAQGKDPQEVLATAEESLRSGAVGLTLMEITKPLSLTAGRRLQLAAEQGKSTGLCIIQEGMGSNAAETRWHCTPVYDAADTTLERWKLIKNKSGTIQNWDVRWDVKSRRVIVVSKTAPPE